MAYSLGLDDTDSLDGMCTTFLAFEAALLIQARGWDLVGYPRLVRLNPNVPWKTRGNGALCIRFGRGRGSPRAIGGTTEGPLKAFPRGSSEAPLGSLVDDLLSLVERRSKLDCPGTNPGLFLTRRRPGPGLYWRAVRTLLDPAEVRAQAEALGTVRTLKNGRGIVGATAAVAWRPRDRTYEVLAFRKEASWGTPRVVDPTSVRAMDHQFPTTFNNLDEVTGRVAITPRSPCPILLGIRGDDPTHLPEALGMIRGEKPMAHLVFETNQGTDDHIRPLSFDRAIPREALRARARVASAPRVLPGGHVVVCLEAPTPLDAVAYEPSGPFRRAVADLAAGDVVTVYGSVRSEPRALNLEKLRVETLAPLVVKGANPRCSCGKAMKSMGSGAGFRCIRCRCRLPRSAALYKPLERSLHLGWYEPPVCSRRHISKPVRRLHLTSVRGPSPEPRPGWQPRGHRDQRLGALH